MTDINVVMSVNVATTFAAKVSFIDRPSLIRCAAESKRLRAARDVNVEEFPLDLKAIGRAKRLKVPSLLMHDSCYTHFSGRRQGIQRDGTGKYGHRAAEMIAGDIFGHCAVRRELLRYWHPIHHPGTAEVLKTPSASQKHICARIRHAIAHSDEICSRRITLRIHLAARRTNENHCAFAADYGSHCVAMFLDHFGRVVTQREGN